MSEETIGLQHHESSKEDDDPILEFTEVDTDSLRPFKIGGIPFYPADSQQLIALTLHKIEKIRAGKTKAGMQHVLPFDPFRFVRLTMSKKYRPLAEQSFINLPVASGMGWMARTLGTPIPETIPTINYAMNLIRLAQAKEYSIFIVGGRDEVLEKLFFNLKRSFPRLRIIGRHSGYLQGEAANRVVEALKKTDPHIILLGLGYENELDWILQNRERLGNSILINVGGSFDIMAGMHKKAPDFAQVRGYTWLWRSINRPHRWYRLFYVGIWVCKVFYWKVFKKK